MLEYCKARTEYFIQCWKHAKNNLVVSILVILSVFYSLFKRYGSLIQLGSWADTSKWPKLPLPWALFIVTAGLLFIILEGGYRLRQDSNQQNGPIVSFFPNRASLPYGSLNDELKKSGDSFWVIWQAGHQVPVLEDYVRAKIRRMILGDPNQLNEIMEQWAQAADAGSADAVKQRIREATDKVKLSNGEVKWTDEKSLSIIIVNPEHNDASGLVRIECIVPYLRPTSRPSFIFRERDYPQLFASFVKAYEEMWKQSKLSD